MAMYLNFHFCLQGSLAANSELTTALADKNKECRKLKHAIELKDGQIASLEEARKKDEGKDSLPFLIRQLAIFPSVPTTNLGGNFTVL